MNRKGLSRPQLAEKIGMHKQTIYDYYNHKAEVSIKTLAALSKEFDIDLCWWFKHESKLQESKLIEPKLEETKMETERLWKQIEQKDNEINSLLKRMEFLESLLQESKNQSTGTEG